VSRCGAYFMIRTSHLTTELSPQSIITHHNEYSITSAAVTVLQIHDAKVRTNCLSCVLAPRFTHFETHRATKTRNGQCMNDNTSQYPSADLKLTHARHERPAYSSLRHIISVWTLVSAVLLLRYSPTSQP
jgi:hypothetical protein